MKRKDFKYHTTFASILTCPVPEKKDLYLATASINELKAYLPKGINLDANWDLIPFVTNVYVANLGNNNSDLITTEVAIASAPHFIYKPIDREHDLNDRIGVIVSYGYSKFSANYAVGAGSEPLTLEQVKDTKDPFNITIGGFLWKVGNDSIIEQIEESNDPDSSKYLSISSSFELGFDECYIARGKSRNINDCEIIKDEKEILSLIPHLKTSKGGTGKKGEDYIWRVIVGDVTPLGAGITRSQAALVKGFLIETEATKQAEIEAAKANEKKLENKEKISVKQFSMKYVKSLADIKNLKQDEMPEVAVASLVETIENGIKDANDIWKAKQSEAETALRTANEAKASLETKAAELEKQVTSVKNELKVIQDRVTAEETQRKFDNRMNTIAETYELDEKASKAVANQIKNLNDESFTTWYGDFEIIAAAKKKAPKGEKKEEEMTPEEKAALKEKKTTKASEKTAEEILDDAKEKKEKVANGTVGEPTFADRFKNAFTSETIEISR